MGGGGGGVDALNGVRFTLPFLLILHGLSVKLEEMGCLERFFFILDHPRTYLINLLYLPKFLFSIPISSDFAFCSVCFHIFYYICDVILAFSTCC